jgi:hypothetical protein
MMINPRRRRSRRNPIAGPVTTYTDGLILIGIGAIVGGLAYFLYSKSQAAAAEANAPPTQIQTGVDSSGNPTFSYVTPGGIGVFSNQTPGALGPSATYNPSAGG